MEEKETFTKKGKDYIWHCGGIIKKVKRYRVPLEIARDLDRKQKVVEKTKPEKNIRLYPNKYRKIVENRIMRKLKTKEVIHHIDGDCRNNKQSNLFITNLSEHKTLHFNLERLARELVKENIIIFDEKERNYFFNEKVRFCFLD